MATKQRIHREWFTTVSRGNRKSCPHCHTKLNGELIYSWFEYHNIRQYHIQDFCVNCWHGVQDKLLQHSDPCGCIFELVAYHCTLPAWLTLDTAKEMV